MADHDQRLKSMLRGFVPELLELLLPAWVGRFDLSSIRWLEQELFLDPPTGERRELDMVAEVTLLPDLLFLLHVEGESGDAVADLRRRMPRYHHGLRHKHDLPVLSVAVYLGVGLEGIGIDEAVERFGELEVAVTRWPYLGLPALDARAHVEGQNILGVALSVRMRIADNDRAWLKARAMQRVATARLTDQQRFLLMEFIEAYMPLEGPHLGEFHRLMVTPDYREATMLAKTSRELGMEEGLEKGLEKGQRLLLRDVLEAKFGPLNEAALRRLESLEGDDLRRLARVQGNAASLAELGFTDA